MLRRLMCFLTGHGWRYLPSWITGDPESARECVRCFLVEQRIRHYGEDGAVKEEWWEPTGRRPKIARME